MCFDQGVCHCTQIGDSENEAGSCSCKQSGSGGEDAGQQWYMEGDQCQKLHVVCDKVLRDLGTFMEVNLVDMSDLMQLQGSLPPGDSILDQRANITYEKNVCDNREVSTLH